MSDDWAAWLCGSLSGAEGWAEPATGADFEGAGLVGVRSHPEAACAQWRPRAAVLRGLEDVQGTAAGAVVPALRPSPGGSIGRPHFVSSVLWLCAGRCDARRNDDLPL